MANEVVEPAIAGETTAEDAVQQTTTSEMIAVNSSSISQILLDDQISSVERIASAFKAKAGSELEANLQESIAELLDLIPELSDPQHRALLPLAEVAAAALLGDKPNIPLANSMRVDLKARIRRNPMIALIRGGGSPTSRVILGLGTLLYFAIPFSLVYGHRLFGTAEGGQLLGVDTSRIVLVAFAGALGSIVSIMVRIRDFANSVEADPAILFFTGFFKPVIGLSFALFVFAVLNSGLLPITFDPAKANYFFAAIGFVSGFSERFASDVATQTERVLTTSLSKTETIKDKKSK